MTNEERISRITKIEDAVDGCVWDIDELVVRIYHIKEMIFNFKEKL